MVALLAGAMFLAPLPVRATMSDPESVASGRTLRRSLLILRRATACAPVLLITQCLDDLKQFVGTDDGNDRLAITPNVSFLLWFSARFPVSPDILKVRR